MKGVIIRRNLILDTALILALIYNSNSVWALAEDQFSLSCFALLLVSLIYYLCLCLRKRHGFYLTIVPVAIVAFSTLMVQLIISLVHDWGGLLDGTWFQYTLILPLLLGILLIRGERYVYDVFLPTLVTVSVIVCFVSVCLWFFACFTALPPTSTTRLMWTSGKEIDSYYGLFYKIQPITIGGINIWRNTSVFPEPPMAAVYYGIIFAINIFYNNKNIYVNGAILVIGLLTTMSTSAYVYIILLLFLYWLRRGNNKDYRKSKSRMIIILALSIPLSYFVFRIGVNKISTSASGMTHLFDFVEGVSIWGDSPIFGFGFDSDDFIWQHYISNYRGGIGYTSGAIFMLIHGGILALMMVVIPLIGYMTTPLRKTSIYFSLFLFLVFLTVVVQNCGAFILCLSLGYANYIWESRKLRSARNAVCGDCNVLSADRTFAGQS